MRLEVFLQSAALKILRQKLSHVSFSTDSPFRFKMAQVLLSSAFYLALLAALAFCAVLVRLLGAAPDPEPDPRTKPKPDKSLRPENTSENNNLKSKECLQDKNVLGNQKPVKGDKPETSSTILATDPDGSETRPGASLVHKQISPVTPRNCVSLVSPLTLFLLSDTRRSSESVKEPSPNKRVQARSIENHQCKARKLD